MRRWFLLTLVLSLTLFAADRSVRAAGMAHEPYGPPSPMDVAVDPATGNIAVAETEQSRVVILDSGWKVLRTVPLNGKPVSVIPHRGGWLALIGGQRPALASIGEQVVYPHLDAPSGGPLRDPRGIALDDAGRLFVFDTGNRRVVAYDLNTGGALFTFGQYAWAREAGGKTETVNDRLQTPVRGDFLPDGRLIVADYDGPVIDPATGQRGGRFSVWTVGATAASFDGWAYPEVPFPTFKAGDVAVDRKTGEVFYAEADFPLTDHDFIRRAPAIGVNPVGSTSYFGYATLTHPRGLAIGSNGEVIVAEADRGQAYAIPRTFFVEGRDESWPRKQRLVSATRNEVVLQYDTPDAVPTVVQVAPADGFRYPFMPAGATERTGEAFTADGKTAPEAGPRHRIALSGLQPGRRYAYRFLVSPRAYPGPLYSNVFMATTRPPEGKTQYLNTRMIVLLFTNVSQPVPGVPKPGPMTPAEIQGVKDRMEVGRSFYWVNSGANLALDYEWVLVDKEYAGFPVPHWGYWPEDEHAEIDRILAEKGVKHADTSSLFVIYGNRVWNANQKKWILEGSGGNTWGSSHDGSAVTTVNAGGDTAWLLVHEHGHGISIDYQYSGQVYHFNHFHWNYFPERYGAHYDGTGAIARSFKDLEWWSMLYGDLVVADDRDGDGLPDRDPASPLDEARFGSDPSRRDTDGDGLDDLEELMAYDGVGDYPGFDLATVAPYYAPNPKNPDTDGDGTPDGADRYPLFPFQPVVFEETVTLDGRLAEGEYTRGLNRPMTSPDFSGAFKLAYTDEYLAIAMSQRAQGDNLPAAMYLELDANNDGFTVGADNQEIRITPKPDGTAEVATNYNDTIIRMKPTWRANDYPMARDIVARWTKQGDAFHVEVGIPRTPELGLYLDRWETIGLNIQLTPQGKPSRRLFQLQQLVELTLR